MHYCNRVTFVMCYKMFKQATFQKDIEPIIYKTIPSSRKWFKKLDAIFMWLSQTKTHIEITADSHKIILHIPSNQFPLMVEVKLHW